MVAIRFASPEDRANGFMLLVRDGTVRTLRNEIFILRENGLAVLDQHNIKYKQIPLPDLDEMDALRNTPAPVL